MSFENKIKKDELFVDLPEQQQEETSGGNFFLFFQQTDIFSSASSDLNISNGNQGISISDQAAYQFSQTTLILASFSGGLNRFRSSRNWGRNLFSKFLK
ncbi:MAG: hypothetical protein MET45_17105 [Nostoc sp. LLA-1]|nr:hypothetical protein [Cyanocohniella sp. LLY]